MPAPNAQRFVRSLLDTAHGEITQDVGGYLATVVGTQAHEVRVRSNAADEADPAEPAAATLPWVPLANGPAALADPVLILIVGKKEYAIRLKDTSGGSAAMPINGRNFDDNANFDFAPTKLILDASSFWANQVNGSEMFVDLRYGTGAGQPAEGNHLHDSRYYTEGEADALFLTNAEGNALYVPISNGSGIVKAYAGQGGAATAATNASTTTQAEIFNDTTTIVLPTGTWDLIAIGYALFSNSSATGGANVRFKSPGVSAQTYGLSGVVNARFGVFFRGVFGNLSGTQTIGAEYTARTAGTASCWSWGWHVIAVRNS